MAVGCIENNR